MRTIDNKTFYAGIQMYHLSLIKNITFEHKAYCVMKTHSTAFMEFSPKSKSQGKTVVQLWYCAAVATSRWIPMDPTIQVDPRYNTTVAP